MPTYGYRNMAIVVQDWFKEEIIIFISSSKITIAWLTDSRLTVKNISES